MTKKRYDNNDYRELIPTSLHALKPIICNLQVIGFTKLIKDSN